MKKPDHHQLGKLILETSVDQSSEIMQKLFEYDPDDFSCEYDQTEEKSEVCTGTYRKKIGKITLHIHKNENKALVFFKEK